MFSTADKRSEQTAVFRSPSHLSVGFLRLLPAHHHRVLRDDVGLDVSGRAGRGLLSCTGLHARRGGPLADAVEGRHSDFVLGVGVQPTDAVAGGGDAVHRLVLAVRTLGSVLNDVVGDGVRVAGVPGDGHAGGGGLCDYGCARRLWQSWGLEKREMKKTTLFSSDYLLVSVHSVLITVILMAYYGCINS